MRKTLLALVLVLAASAAYAAAPLNYAGTWVFDRAASKDLPPQYTDVTAWKLDVTQKGQALTVKVHIESNRPAFDQTFQYNLDGPETATTTTIMTPMGKQETPTFLTATVAEDGSLRITIARELTRNGEKTRVTVREHWSIDGNRLTVHRDDERPQGGNQNFDAVFTREKPAAHAG